MLTLNDLAGTIGPLGKTANFSGLKKATRS